MVNKPSVDKRRTKYVVDQNELLDRDFDMHQVTTDLKLLRYASTNLLVRAYSNWERFVSDWHVMAVTVDASRLIKSIADAAHKVATAEVARLNWDLTSFPLVTSLQVPSRHLTMDQVRSVLDARGRNLSIATPDELGRFEDRYLGTGLARPHTRFGLTRRGKAIVDEGDWEGILLARSVRHALAHGSDSAGIEMNTRIDAAASSSRPVIASLGRSGGRVSHGGIGAFLDTELHAPSYDYGTRARTLAALLRDAAGYFTL